MKLLKTPQKSLLKTTCFGVSLTLALFVAQTVFAGAGTEGAAFLEIPTGGGPAALGSAYSALAGDAYAPVYNPAGLGLLDSTQIAGQHLSYLESIRYEFASFVHPIAEGKSLGVSAQYLTSGNITGRDEFGAETGSFDSHYGAYSVAYGQSLGKLSLGVTGKFIEAGIDNVGAKAFGADIGALMEVKSNLFLSAVVQNMGSKLKFLRDGDPLPLKYTAGVAWQPVRTLNLSSDFVYRRTGVAGVHMGIQWTPLSMVSLRAGYRTDQIKELSPIAGLSMGMGLHLWGQELDYAWVPYGDLGNTQYVSIVIRFGDKQKSKRNLIHYQNLKRPMTVKNHDGQAVEPEYQQLMQLLTEDEKKQRVAKVKVAEPVTDWE